MMGRSLFCWPADSTVFQAKVQLLKGPIKPSPVGFVPLPKSVTAERIRQNLDVFDFVLEDADVLMISNLEGYADPAPIPDEITF